MFGQQIQHPVMDTETIHNPPFRPDRVGVLLMTLEQSLRVELPKMFQETVSLFETAERRCHRSKPERRRSLGCSRSPGSHKNGCR